MKKSRKFISVALIMMMIFGIATTSIFAVNEQSEGQVSEQAETEAEAVPAVEAEAGLAAVDLQLLDIVANGDRMDLKVKSTVKPSFNGVECPVLAENDEYLFTVETGSKCVVTAGGKTLNVYATVVTKSSKEGKVTLQWPVAEGADASELKVFADGTDTNVVPVVKGQTATATVSNLKQGKTVSLKVVAGAEAYETKAVKETVDYKTPSSPKSAKAESDYRAINVSWSKVSGVTKYKVLRSDGKYWFKGASTTSFKDRDIDKGTDCSKKYSYRIYAVNGDKKAKATSTKKVGCVRTMYYDLYLKTNRTLTCHCSGHSKTHTFKAGQHLKGVAYGAGRYTFYYTVNGKRHKWCVARLSCTRTKADYMEKTNYSKSEALNFVNNRGLKSNTKYLVWCSYYTQHVYVFKGTGKAGQWDKILLSTEVSTGKSWAPSPSGMKKIWQKVSYRHKLPWWSSYSSWNSFHGKQSNWPLGVPMASGCIRLTNDNAKWVYNNVPIGTTSYMF